MEISLILAGASGVHEIKPLAVVFFVAFGFTGCALTLNLYGFADGFFLLTSKVVGGFTGSASPKTLRIVGAVLIILASIGMVTEISKPFRS